MMNDDDDFQLTNAKRALVSFIVIGIKCIPFSGFLIVDVQYSICVIIQILLCTVPFLISQFILRKV